MTSTIVAIASAIAGVAGLLLHLYKTQWSERSRWKKEETRLEHEARTAGENYTKAIASGDPDHDSLLARWRVCATQLADHRAAGLKAGFLDRAQ